jgi:hypothetical protein
MAIWQEKSPHSIESAKILQTWASLYKAEPYKAAQVSWSPVTEMIRVAEAEAQKLESELKQLLNVSDARLRAISLCDPLVADAGLNRWLKREREEAYSDWLKWILDQLGSPADVLGVLGVTESEIVAIATSQENAFKIEREQYISAGRLDLLLTLDDSVMIIVEVKKLSAEASDTAKQAGYYEWLESKRVPRRRALLLTTDAAEDKYENFSTLLWADVCIRLRCLFPALNTRIGSVKTAMFVAFVSAVETNLLNLVAPSRETDAVERFSYARTIEHLKKYQEALCDGN